MTALGSLLVVAAAAALGLAVLASPGGGFDLGLIGLSVVGALLGGLLLAVDHRRTRAHAVAPSSAPAAARWPDAPSVGSSGNPPGDAERPAPPPALRRPHAPHPAAFPAAPVPTSGGGSADGVRIAWALSEEPGVTPDLRAALLTHFGSWQALHHASVEELEEAPGIDYAMARRIRAALDR